MNEPTLLRTAHWERSGGDTFVEQTYRLETKGAAAYLKGKVSDDYARHCIGRAAWLRGWLLLVHHRQLCNPRNRPEEWWQISPRPYLLGRPCDGLIDECVLFFANLLTEAIGLKLPQLLCEAYPDTTGDDFSYLTDPFVGQQLFIPPVIDPLLVLDGLGEINNHTLADLLGDHLEQLGLIPADWPRISVKPNQKAMRAVYRRRNGRSSVLPRVLC